MTWAELLESYLLARAARLRPHSVRTIRSTVQPLIEFWGGVDVSEFELADADQFRAWRMEQRSIRGGKVTLESADDTLRRGRTLLRFAVRRRVIKSNGLDGLESPARYAGRDVSLDRGQIDRLLAVRFPYRRGGARADGQFRALVLVLWTSGCRVSEALRNTWDNVDGRALTIPVALSKSRKAGLAIMSAEARAALNAIRSSSPWLFPSAGRGPTTYRTAWSRWTYAAEKSGIADELPGVAWHCLRHSAATDMLSAGVPLETVSMILRHGSLQMTKRYTHLRRPTIEAAIDATERHRNSLAPEPHR